MYTLSDIYMLETSHYIQSISDQYIIESYICESFRDVVSNLIEKIKKMFNKVKEFFKRLFGKESNNDKKLEEIEKVVNNNSKLKNKKIKTTDTNKFDKIVNEANKQGKMITAKQIIAAAGVTTATIGAIILGIKKFKKNTPNELEKQEKEAIKKAEDIKKEEDKKKVINNNTTNTEPKSVNKEDKKINYKLANNKYKGNGTRQKVNTTIKTKFIPKKAVIGLPEKSSADGMTKEQIKKNDQEMVKLQNELEKVNAEIKAIDDNIKNVDNIMREENFASDNLERNIMRIGRTNNRLDKIKKSYVDFDDYTQNKELRIIKSGILNKPEITTVCIQKIYERAKKEISNNDTFMKRYNKFEKFYRDFLPFFKKFINEFKKSDYLPNIIKSSVIGSHTDIEHISPTCLAICNKIENKFNIPPDIVPRVTCRVIDSIVHDRMKKTDSRLRSNVPETTIEDYEKSQEKLYDYRCNKSALLNKKNDLNIKASKIRGKIYSLKNENDDLDDKINPRKKSKIKLSTMDNIKK